MVCVCVCRKLCYPISIQNEEKTKYIDTYNVCTSFCGLGLWMHSCVCSITMGYGLLFSFSCSQFLLSECARGPFTPGLPQQFSKSYYYGSHYSNSGIVLHFLVRVPPFTEMFLAFQGTPSCVVWCGVFQLFLHYRVIRCWLVVRIHSFICREKI